MMTFEQIIDIDRQRMLQAAGSAIERGITDYLTDLIEDGRVDVDEWDDDGRVWKSGKWEGSIELEATGCLETYGGYYAPWMNIYLPKYHIDTRLRVCAFLSQTAHESGMYRYSREIASGERYEGRRDLGNTQRGDGIRYKGRGLIQITGRANYERRWPYGRRCGYGRKKFEYIGGRRGGGL